ncbi:MAG: hypothetical protein JNM75_03105 [Rhodospirillales bacterium]|nr:hypothetical protein [Rhodospirillales bacterium]
MKRGFSSGIALSAVIAAGAIALSMQSGNAAESPAKKTLMESLNQCEMKQKTDARESCMDQAWATYKKATATEHKMK